VALKNPKTAMDKKMRSMKEIRKAGMDAFGP
jgi:hypothetical protein